MSRQRGSVFRPGGGFNSRSGATLVSSVSFPSWIRACTAALVKSFVTLASRKGASAGKGTVPARSASP